MNIDWFYFETQKLIRIVTLELLGIQYIKFYSFPLKIVGRARASETGEKRERESERQKETETKGREGKKKRPSSATAAENKRPSVGNRRSSLRERQQAALARTSLFPTLQPLERERARAGGSLPAFPAAS